MGTRGVLYVVWGKVDDYLDRSRESLRAWHPELPVHVVRYPDSKGDGALLQKSAMGGLTPFDETLYLDADTVVLAPLDFGFMQAQRHGLACSICECPQARRYPEIAGDQIEYNTGVLFWTAKASKVMADWATLAHSKPSSILFNLRGRLAQMKANDQAGFSHAIEANQFCPFVLPLNWNFRPRWQWTWHGPIVIWHDTGPVPRGIVEWNAQQNSAGALLGFSKFGPHTLYPLEGNDGNGKRNQA